MNRKSFLALAAALILAVLGATALAQNNETGGKHARGFARGPFGQRMATELGLTDAQKTQIQQLLQSEKTSIEPLRQQLRTQHEQLQAATQNGQFDEAQVRTLATQQAQTMANLTVERERVKSQIFKVLTPEQRTKAEQMKQQFAGRRHGFRGQHKQGQQPQQ